MSTDDSSLFAVLFPLPTVLLLGIYSALAKSVLGEEAFRGVSLLFCYRSFGVSGLLDPEFAEASHELQPEAALMRAMIEARQSQNLTQKELAERCGIAQTEISRIERGIRNPSIRVLQKIAEGMNMYLHISFLPRDPQPGTRSA